MLAACSPTPRRALSRLMPGMAAAGHHLGLHPAIPISPDMPTMPSPNEISQCSSTEGLHHALDHTYLRLLETAKTDWQRLFGGHDQSDSCVSVHIRARTNGKVRRRSA